MPRYYLVSEKVERYAMEVEMPSEQALITAYKNKSLEPCKIQKVCDSEHLVQYFEMEDTDITDKK